MLLLNRAAISNYIYRRPSSEGIEFLGVGTL